jgi:hypothetical protein
LVSGLCIPSSVNVFPSFCFFLGRQLSIRHLQAPRQHEL